MRASSGFEKLSSKQHIQKVHVLVPYHILLASFYIRTNSKSLREDDMPLRKSRTKTSEFFSKTIKSLKSMLVFHGGQGIHTRPPCHPFSCSSRKIIPGQDVCSIKQQHRTDEFYSDRWMMDHDQFDQVNGVSTSVQDKVIVVSSSNNTNEQCSKIKKQRDGEREIKKIMETRNKEEAACLKSNKQGSTSYRVISIRMKELEMMEFKDVDHVLDVEEVLHYYSRLRSPVYLDIVDSFFTDMYAELHKPQRNCLHGSSRRLAPLKLATAAI